MHVCVCVPSTSTTRVCQKFSKISHRNYQEKNSTRVQVKKHSGTRTFTLERHYGLTFFFLQFMCTNSRLAEIRKRPSTLILYRHNMLTFENIGQCANSDASEIKRDLVSSVKRDLLTFENICQCANSRLIRCRLCCALMRPMLQRLL